MTPHRLAEIRERAELSRKRDWVVAREAIADIDGLLEHIGELQGAANDAMILLFDQCEKCIFSCNADKECRICTGDDDCDVLSVAVRLQNLIGGSGE